MKISNTKIRILIVEDEIILAQDLALRLIDYTYQIVGIAPNAVKAYQALTLYPETDLILMDIMLQGEKDGITLAQEINEKFSIPIIFLTSYVDENLIDRAKKVNPCAYLMKPFNEVQLNIAIEIAFSNFSKNRFQQEVLEKKNYKQKNANILPIKKSLFLKKNNRFEKVLLKEIQFLKADSNYTTIHTKNDKFVYATLLKHFEHKLGNHQFLRVHRSFIVNVDCVQGFEGNLIIVNNTKIPVSKGNKEKVFNLFNFI